MANFDMDSYLAQRFAGVGPDKLAELDQARNDKLAGLQKFRQNIAANSANILAEKQATETARAATVANFLGTDTGSVANNTINALAAVGPAWSAFTGMIPSGIHALDAVYLNKDIPQEAKDADTRRLKGTATPEDIELLALPRGYTDKTKVPGSNEGARALKQGYETNQQRIDKYTRAVADGEYARNFFDLSGAVDQSNKKNIVAALKEGAAGDLAQATKGYEDFKAGNKLSGLGDMLSGAVGSTGELLKAGANNPMGVVDSIIDSAPQTISAAAGLPFYAGSTLAYGADTLSKGLAAYAKDNKGALPSHTEVARQAAWSTAAAGAEALGEKLMGVTKLWPKGAGERTREALKASLLGRAVDIAPVRTATAMAQGGAGEYFTEGFQTVAENKVLNKETSLEDAYVGASLGALSGGVMSGAIHGLSEIAGTTPDKIKSSQAVFKEKLDLAAMAKANDTSTLLDPTVRTYDPLKAVGVLFEHAKSVNTTPEVQQANLLKTREVVQDLETAHDRKVALVDDASNLERVTESKNELISLKEQLSLADPNNESQIQALKKQIAFREEVVALSSDRVALKRLSGEVKRGEVELATAKGVQENLATQLRQKVTDDEVAAHVVKATRPMSADNMPDIEESRQSVQALVNISMVSPGSISVDTANNLVFNKNSYLTPEQRDYFRQFSEARIAENKLMNLDKVHQAVMTGSKQDTGISEYRNSLAQSYEVGDQKAAERSLSALTRFYQSHVEKAALAADLFKNAYLRGDKQVLRAKNGGWEVVPPGKPLDPKFVTANGGFEIHTNSDKFVSNVTLEAAALEAVMKEQQAAFTLRFGKPSSSFVAMPADVSTSAPKVNTSVAPVQKTGESIQGTPAAQTTAAPTSVAAVNWDTIAPGQQVTLYRGESAANTSNGEWWTTDKTKAEKYGQITEVILPSEVVGKHSIRGHNGKDEFVFPTEGNRPPDLLKALSTPKVTNAQTTEAKQGQQEEKKQAPAAVKIDLLEALDGIKTGVSSVGAAKFAPNKEQAEGITKIIEFLNTPNEVDADGNVTGNIFVLEGKAGTGKTSLVQEAVAQHLAGDNTVTVAAISHKAKALLRDKLTRFIKTSDSKKGKVESFAVAGLLGMVNKKGLARGVVELVLPQDGVETPIDGVSLLVLDEASMMSSDLIANLQSKLPSDAKLIYLGDRNQVGPIEKSPKLQGKISQVFSMDTGDNKHSLTVRVRQGEDSRILPYADYFWNNAEGENSVQDPVPEAARESEGELVMLPDAGWVDKIIPLFKRAFETKNPNLVKVIAYNDPEGTSKNAPLLRNAVEAIRKAMFGNDLKEYNEGEQLIMTKSYGDLKTPEGLENSAELIVEKVESLDATLKTATGEEVAIPRFVLTVRNINTGNSHTLSVVPQEHRARVEEITSGLYKKARASGGNKETWKAYDRASNLSAPVTYAYILTAHKAQGSTYDVAVVLEDNIHSAKDGNAGVSRLMYTAITRASKLGVVVSIKNQDTQQETTAENTSEFDQANFVAQEAANAEFDEAFFLEEDLAPVKETADTVLAGLQEANKETRTMRKLNAVEQGMLDTVLAGLKASLGTEIESISHFFIQEDKEGAEKKSPKGTFFVDANSIAIHAGVFTSSASDVYASPEQRLQATVSHELAHLRDASFATEVEYVKGTNDGYQYESERLSGLNPGGSLYVAATAAMEKDPVLAKWFGFVFSGKYEAYKIPRELYAQLYSLYLTKPELMNEETGLAKAYQAIQGDIEFHNQKGQNETQSFDDGRGIPEKAGKSSSTSAPEADGTNAGSQSTGGIPPVAVDPKAPPPGTLSVLQGVKSKRDTPYRERNLLVDHFYQKAAGLATDTQRPLVMVKDFISSLGKSASFAKFLSVNSYTASEKQQQALSFFQGLAPIWQKKISQYLVKGDNGPSYQAKSEKEKKKFLYRNPINWLMKEDTEGKVSFDENVNTAIMYSAINVLLELADAPVTHSKKTINHMLGRDEKATVPPFVEQLLADKGTRATLVRNSAGKTVSSALGMQTDGKVGQNVMVQLEGGLGAQVERLLVSLGLATLEEIPADQMATAYALIAETDAAENAEEEEASTNEARKRKTKQISAYEKQYFLRVNRDAKGNLAPEVQEIVDAMKGSNNILDKLFSVESHMKFPSLTPVENTQSETTAGQKIPALLNKVTNQNRAQKSLARKDFWQLLREGLNDATVNALSGIVEVNDQVTQITKRLGLKAKNDSISRDLKRYADYMMNTLLDKDGKVTETGIYFDYSVQLQQRVGVDSNVINQQASKVHRPLFYRPDWESKVDMENIDMMNNFYMRVGEGFGIKTERTTVDPSLKAIAAIVAKPAVNQAVKDLVTFNRTGKELSLSAQENLVAVVKEGGQDLATLDALLALVAYEEAKANNAKSFVTHIHASVDGVTNGPILAQAMFGAGTATDETTDVEALNANMARGGISTNENQSFGDYKSNPDNKDTYEHNISKTIDLINTSVSEAINAGDTKLQELASAVELFTGRLTKDDGNITSDGRGIIKGPVTQMMYGAGIPKTLSVMAEEFVAQIYEVFEQSATGVLNGAGEVKYPKAKVVAAINALLEAGKTGKTALTFGMSNNLLEASFDSVESVSAIKAAFLKVYEQPITTTIEENFAAFRARTGVFNQTVELIDGIYGTMYAALREQYLDSMVAAELRQEGTGIPFENKQVSPTMPATATSPAVPEVRKNQPIRDLNKQEEQKIKNRLAALLPTMRTLLSIESSDNVEEQHAAGILISKTTEKLSRSLAYTTEVKFKPLVQKGFEVEKSKGVSVYGFEKGRAKAGVRMLPLLTQSTESYISHMTQLLRQLGNTHDSVHGGLSTIHEAAEAMNRNTFHALLNYSPMQEAYNSLARTLDGLGDVLTYYQTELQNLENAKGTPEYQQVFDEQQAIIKGLNQYLYFYGLQNELENTEGGKYTNVLVEALKKIKEQAAEADSLKLDAMLQWTYVGQYALENMGELVSSYEVTPEDLDKIAAKRNEVSAVVPAVLMKEAREMNKHITVTFFANKRAKEQRDAELADTLASNQRADNMPDIEETPVPPSTRTYSTQDVYQALKKGPVTAAFDKHLTDVLVNIVEKLHGTFGSFKEALMKDSPKTALDIYSEALATGKAPFAFSLTGAGFTFTDQQAFVAEQVHATILAALENTDGTNTVVYSELSKLFRETRTRLEAKDFFKGDWATAQPHEVAEAEALYNRIFNELPADASGKSNYLAEFAALGLAHEGFNKLLQVPTKMAPPIMQDKTILGMLTRLFNRILEAFNGKLTRTQAGQQADQKLKALVTRLVEIENKRELTLNAERGGVLKFIDKQAQDIRMGKKNAISKIANSPKFMKSRNVFIGAASGVVATVADSQVGLFFKNIDAIRNEHFSGIPGVAYGFLSEMNGPRPAVQAMLRAVKLFEGKRKDIITMTGKFVLQGFDNQGKDLTKEDKEAVTKVLLHTGAHTLLDHFDTDKLATLLKDPALMQKEIKAFEAKLSSFTPAQREYFIEQSRALGYYLVTGDVTLELMMKNANNIAKGYLSVHENVLTEAEVKDATATIDALTSLYAMSYTSNVDKNSLVKTLDTENQRADKGNGVRLVLLSHKEMEQQSRDRLFSSSAALMVKGYVPEIYNPHTDVKAANKEEGRILEDLGYIKGAPVGNDPSDVGAEAKHLYTLRDGGALPWLSGIFSFTGRRSKGTKHHGQNAHRMQQSITADKQAARTARPASQSGSNFDPTKAKGSQMVPLLNANGAAVNYQYMMKSSTKDTVLERDTQFDAVMGSLNGSIFDKENSVIHNRKAVEVLYKEFDAGYNKEPKAYLSVSATSKEPELREIYQMLPKETKDAIRAVWGKDEMMVRANNLDIAFGYRKRSISNVFEKDEEDRNFMEESFIWFAEGSIRLHAKAFVKVNGQSMTDEQAARYAKRAAVYVRRGENVWQALVKETKDIFVIKSGISMLNNIASNLVLLKLYGVSNVAALRDMQIAWVGAQNYDKDTKRLFELESLLASKAATTGVAEIKREIQELNDAIARNPVRELIDAGLMPSIVEDVSESEDQYAYKSQFIRSTDKYTDKLNKHVKAAGKQLYMAHDTQMYKIMAKSTQLSDFVARYALYQHLINRKDNPIAKKFAIQEASDAFVNYDVPMHRSLQYLDDMGIMMFTKYFLRIQRVIRGRFKHAPGKVAMLLIAQGYFDWLPSTLDSSILFKFGNNPFSMGALNFPGSLDELVTTKAALSLFK